MIIGINAFADQCFSVVGQYLPYPLKLHQDEVGEAFLAHAAPGLAIVVILILHQRFAFRHMPVVKLRHRVWIQFLPAIVFQLQLNQAYDGIVDDTLELGANIIGHTLLPFFLYGADALCLNEDLVDDGNSTQYTPTGAIIPGLLQENITASGDGLIVLQIRCIHGWSECELAVPVSLASKITKRVRMFTLNCGGRLLSLDQPVVMGIINCTPDSFYAESRQQQVDDCLRLAEKMLEEGAGILDMGGQSTRPGSEMLSPDEEMLRVIPCIQAVKTRFPESILSVDTFYSRVATEAVAAGAAIVNDISAGKIDSNMLPAVGRMGVPYIAMHMQGRPKDMQQQPHYENLTQEIIDFFIQLSGSLQANGIAEWIVDPGFGFGKTAAHNFQLIHDLEIFHLLNRPILMGISRKSTIYKTLGVTAEEALNGSTVLHTIGLMKGVHLLRVHDVKEAREAVELVGNVLRYT